MSHPSVALELRHSSRHSLGPTFGRAGLKDEGYFSILAQLIGVMKCGTSSLFRTFEKHPEVAASGVKELRFFESAEAKAKGQAWYLDQFSFDSRRHHIAVEASPTYTHALPRAAEPERIRPAGPFVLCM